MFYLLVVVSTALFCVGLVFVVKPPFRRTIIAAVKQLDVILNDSLADKAKDGLILRNLGNLLFYFVGTIIALWAIAFVCILPIYFFTNGIFEEYQYNDWYFIGSMVLGSMVLLAFRNRSSDYSFWSKLLHTIILDNYHIGKFLFKKEKKRRTKPETREDFVVVTGLARGGTTALTNMLFHEDDFHSISYANMPFLLAPNRWKKIYSPKKVTAKERAHGDKVVFSQNSIEALEEYFFKVFLNDNYIKNQTLVRHEISEDLFASYLSYQEFFQKKPTTKYLAKNNNFLLRYESMREQNKLFTVCLLFRKPIDHARSLLRQHINFCEQQSNDSFVRTYMNWLGHHEFGLDQKVFDFGRANKWDVFPKNSINYWIAVWINYYAYILSLPEDDRFLFIAYKDFLETPNSVKKSLEKHLNTSLHEREEPVFTPRELAVSENDIDTMLLAEANSLYETLLAKRISC